MPRTSCRLALLTLLLITAAAGPASARWREGGVPFAYSGSYIHAGSVASGPGGVSMALQTGFQNTGMAVARMTGAGDESWLPTNLLVGGGGDLVDLPRIAPAPGDGLYASWLQWDYDFDLFTYTERRVRVQHVLPDRTTLWGPGGIAAFPAQVGIHSQSQLVAGGGGSVLVAAFELDSSTFLPLGLRVQRILPDSTRVWGAAGAAVAPAVPAQMAGLVPQLLEDGAGGAFVGWYEASLLVPGEWEWRLQRLSAAGAPMWPAGGVLVASSATGSPEMTLHADGAGGVVVVLPGSDSTGFYTIALAQRVGPTGALLWGPAPLEWVGSDEVLVASQLRSAADGSGVRVLWRNAANQVRLRAFSMATGAAAGPIVTLATTSNLTGAGVVPTADGGSIVVWSGSASLPGQVKAQRVNASGTTLWNNGGVALASFAGTMPSVQAVVPDGAEGAVAVYGGPSGLMAQRVLHDGDLPMLDGRLHSATDAPGDEGGALRLGYTAPYADPDDEAPEVTGYNVWRLVPGSAATARAVAPADEGEALAALAAARDLRVRLTPAQALRLRFPAGNWESLGFHAAVLDTGYQFVVATRNDSGPAVPDASESFVVTAHTAVASVFGVSAAISGRSLDNLAPAMPQALAGAFAAGALALSWQPGGEPDLAGYRVHRGVGAAFVPGPGNLLAEVSAADYTDPAGVTGQWYKVVAVDRHGNTSPAATLAPTAVTDAPLAGGAAVDFLRTPGANPAAGEVAVEFGLRTAGTARVRVLDTQGRLVAVLAEGPFVAGAHRVAWAPRAGRAGLYFVRFEAAGFEAVRRVVVAR